MLRLRGDGSARSQQTRLGSALGSYRDRSFDGLRILWAGAASKHKGVAMYSLETADESASWGPWGPSGDLGDKGPHESSANDSGDYSLLGDLGDLEGVTPRVETDFSQCPEGAQRDTRAHVCIEGGDNVPNVPKVPISSASDCSESADPLGTSEGKVPTTSPTASEVPKTANRARVDLADFRERPMPPDGKRS